MEKDKKDDSLVKQSVKTLKRKALSLIKKKMCRCEKKLKRKYGRSGSMAICTKSILQRKGLKMRNFTCKKGKRVKLSKCRK